MLDLYVTATQALDAAIELDKAYRNVPANLLLVAAVGGAIEAAWAGQNDADVSVLEEIVWSRKAKPHTMDELAVEVGHLAGLLRRASAGVAADVEPAMRLCLAMHSLLLARGLDEFKPMGLAA